MEKDGLEQELDEMHLKQEELLEELEFKEKENLDLQKKIQEMEGHMDEMEEKIQGREMGKWGKRVN
jgi:peptidoglycan hydrolase CwlO-like protein